MRSKRFRDSDYLDHIANRLGRIKRATAGVDLAVFLNNEDLQAAIERYIEVIGEAAGKLSQAIRDLAPEVPWSQVIGARNVIVHGYAEIEPDRIWDIVMKDLPSLQLAVDRLRRLSAEQPPLQSSPHAESKKEPGRDEDVVDR